MKKIKSILVFVLILSFLTVTVCTNASALVINDGDFGYELNTSKHEATLVSYNGIGGTVQLPDYFQDYPVTTVGRDAFSGNEAISDIIFSDTITTVEEYAFMNCTSLETVTIGKTVTQIADSAFNNDSVLTIACYYDSCAHNFAKAQNIPFILLDSVLLGDANGDGYVNISDVTDIQRAVAEMETLDDLRKKAADVNSDGVVTIDDATFLQTYLAEFETAYPIGEVTAQ